MRNKIVLFLVVIYFFGACTGDKKEKTEEVDVAGKTNFFEKKLKRALANGYFYENNNPNVNLLIYQEDIYFLTKKGGFSKDKFKLHLVRDDNTFLNKDFYKVKYEVDDSLKGVFNKLSILYCSVDLNSCKFIRAGQFKRLDNGKVVDIWSKTIKTIDVEDIRSYYKNQLQKLIGLNILKESFYESLRLGSFFKIQNNFYLLLIDDELYVITKDTKSVEDLFMLHFVRKDYTFKNLSFNFKDKEIQSFLKRPFSEFKVAKIFIPDNDEYVRIRIGQYNKKGNIWSQEINIKDVMSNPLLKYNNDFK